MRIPIFLVSLLMVQMASPPLAYAYIDPSTGGMLLQLLLAGVAGALIIIKLYWEKLRSIFSSKSNRGEAAGEGRKE